MSVDIHSTAIVDPGARLGEGTSVGPYSIIGPDVELGRGNRIASHVVIEGRTRIGDDNEFFQFASVGAKPQDLKYRGEESVLEIGDRNVIREYATLHPGTEGGGMVTRAGNQNLFMALSHIGHDCVVGDGNVFANSCALAGHVTIGSSVILGGLSAVHQFVRIGDHALLSGGSMVVKDVPPFCIAQGDRARLAGINHIGMERHGFSKDDVKRIKKLYRFLFLSSGPIQQKVEDAKEEFRENEHCQAFLEVFQSSTRGVTLPASRRSESVESQ